MIVLLSLVSLGLVVASVFAWAQHRQLGKAAPPCPAVPPAVTVLKPLKGVDPDLAANLASFFALDYPAYELIFGVDDLADPAVALVRALRAAHPQVDARIAITPHPIGLNPKVNNLAGMAPMARHEILVISDSNVRVGPGYLKDLVSHLEQPGVGLVSSLFRGVRARGMGGTLESLQLNTFVMGGVAAVEQLIAGVCVVGKSMAMRRETFAAIGGCHFLAQFLAEDQVCGEEVAALGLRVTVAREPVDNVLGRQPLRTFLSRHLRWAKIRRRMDPAAYAGELLTNPVFVATVGACALRDLRALAVFGGALLVKSALALLAERGCGVRRPFLAYPVLVLLKDLLIGLVWAVPFVVSTVQWRGHLLRVGPRTLLTPVNAETTASLEVVTAEVTG